MKFNEKKTGDMVLASRGPRTPQPVVSMAPYLKPTVSNLALKLDRGFKLDLQIGAAVKSRFGGGGDLGQRAFFF